MTSLQAWYDLQSSLRFVSLSILGDEPTGKQHFTLLPVSKTCLPQQSAHELCTFPKRFNCPLVSSLKRTAFTPTIHQLSTVSETKFAIIKGGLVHSWAEFNPEIWAEHRNQNCPPMLTHHSCHWADRRALPQSKGHLHQQIHSNPLPGKLPPCTYKPFQ